MKKWQPVCAFCGAAVPPHHDLVTQTTPPKYEEYGRLSPGNGWIVCGESCAGLPDGAWVFPRRST